MVSREIKIRITVGFVFLFIVLVLFGVQLSHIINR